jgi:hypothetical protein
LPLVAQGFFIFRRRGMTAVSDSKEIRGETCERMSLAYCQRCGALRVYPARLSLPVCSGCTRALGWLKAEVRR